MENSFKSIIQNSNSLSIFLPSKPDLDQVSSALSLYLVLKDIKAVSIVGGSDMTVAMNRLIGIDKVSSDSGNKNLVIGFSNYDANGIERVSYDIIDNQFKLTVIPKSGIIAPKKEQVQISYEGVASDTIIFFGGTTDADFPQLNSKGYEKAKMYHVGTQPLTVDPSRIVYTYAQPLASVSELTFFLLNEAQLAIPADAATNLLMGIESATDNYKTGNISAETFEVTGALLRLGGKRNAGQGLSADRYPKGAIPRMQNENAGSSGGVSADEEDVITAPTDFADFSGKDNEDSHNKTADRSDPSNPNNDDVLNPPNEWLQPKVFRGTSLD